MKKYAYLTASYTNKDVDDTLNKLGDKGWKLVSVVKSTFGEDWFDFYFIKELG